MEKKNSFKEYFRLVDIGHYLLRIFGKKDPNAPKSINLTLMHGINRVSIVLFLAAILFFVIRRFFF